MIIFTFQYSKKQSWIFVCGWNGSSLCPNEGE